MTVKAALKAESTYGTPVTMGAGDLMPLVSESIQVSVERSVRRPLGSAGQVTTHTKTRQQIGGRMSLVMRYAGMDDVLKWILGTQNDTVLASSYDQHNHKSTNVAQLATVGLDRGAFVHELESVTVQQATFRVDSRSQLLEVDLTVAARDLDEDSAQTPSSWTWSGDEHPVLWEDLVFQLAEDGQSLATVDIDSFELTISYGLDSYYGPQGQYLPEHPVRTTRTVSGRITVPRYANNDLADLVRPSTLAYATAIFTGPEKSAGNDYVLGLYLPGLRLAGGPGGKLLPRQEYSFQCEAAGVPSGWSSEADQEILIQTRN